MESTGVYWIPLWQVLSDDKFEVCLVKARHFKNVPGKKTDVEDCQWLQFLHSVGLLRGSYRPEQAICGVRTLLQYRGELIRFAAEHIQHMQKALEQMNPLSRPTPNPRVSLSSASSAYRTTMLPWPSRRRSTFWAVSSM